MLHKILLHSLFSFLLLLPDALPGQQLIEVIGALNQDTVKQGIPALGQTKGQDRHKGTIDEYILSNQSPPSEKIYLHLDRPDYIQGDTIWFKAYSWYGYDQTPDTISAILYTDLINPEGKIKITKKLLIQNGTSRGDFCLDTTISPGRYMLRAYTRRMGNLNMGEPFYQTITINPSNQNFQVECTPVIMKQAGNDSLKVRFSFFEIDQRGDLNNSYNHNLSYSLKVGDKILQTGNVLATNTKEQVFKSSLTDVSARDSLVEFGISIHDSRVTYEKQFQIPLREQIDIQFLPEGGKLVNGLESKIVFKAIGPDGLSREVKGEIKDGNENVVTGFESSHKGMGAFLLKPDSDKKYFAHLWHNNLKYVIPLPDASEEGCIMAVEYLGKSDSTLLKIKQKHSGTTAQKYVVGSSYGKIWFSALVKMIKDSCYLRVPMELLPEGVCRLTVMDDDFNPESERLIYVDKYQRFKIEVIPDSSSYSTRSKVTLLVKTIGYDGTPLQTDLSLAVVDKEQIINYGSVSGICEYKLLESELKGHIEDAGFYFKGDSCTDYSALDLLLLTQGYRKFVPDNMKPDELKFQPERSFEISGNIKFSGSKSREKKINYHDIGLSLICFSESPYIGQSNPDSLGKFRFQIPLRYGKSHSLLQATTARKKPFYGDIFIDEPPALPQFEIPLTTFYNIEPPTIEIVRQLQTVRKTEISKNPAYGIKTINLPEVTVTAKAENWYLDFKKDAKKIVDLDSLDPEGNKFENIFDLLIREFGAEECIMPSNTKMVLLPASGMGARFGKYFPIYVINGETYANAGEHDRFLPLMNFLSSMHVNEIKKLMVLPPGNIALHYADFDVKSYVWQSLVVIETYSNNSYRGDAQGIKTFILDGLDAPRGFYSPRYDGPLKNSPVYDASATLFWNPLIKTDASGQAKVEFFTSDRKSVIEVVINGIEIGSGNPGQGQILINSTVNRLK